ncbi:MAG: gene transfer agent family protein [Pseudomonadota bacterium]
MANPWRGDVALVIDGRRHVLRLTLGALAALEAELDTGSLVKLVERFEASEFSSRDVLALLRAGLVGGQCEFDPADLEHAAIDGGPMRAAQVAAELLARAFMVPNP